MISNQVSAEAMRGQLQAAKSMLESGKAQGVRLRHIKDSGEPNYAMRKFAADNIFGDELRTERELSLSRRRLLVSQGLLQTLQSLCTTPKSSCPQLY